MRTLLFGLIVGLIITTPLRAQEVTNDFVLKDLRLEKCKQSDEWCLIVEAKGTYKHMRYPQMKIFVNDQLVANTGGLYGLELKDGYSIATTLKELPDAFECFLVITDMTYTDNDLFVLKKQKSRKIKKTEEIPLESEGVNRK